VATSQSSLAGSYDIGKIASTRLFGDVQAAVMPKLLEHTLRAHAIVHDVVFTLGFHRVSVKPLSVNTGHL
jgi:hypothetical protein